MRFEFATATRIVFGSGTIRKAGALCRGLGRHALIVTGRDASRLEPLLAALRAQEVAATIFTTEGEPELETVVAGRARASSEKCDMVIGMGGGSALDAAKAIAAMMTNEGELLDYLEVIGRGRTLTSPSAPYVAIPTTAGTGSEVTRNAVLASPRDRLKVSLRSPLMLARVALVDPELTHNLPPAITASTGLDALTQLIEPFVSPRANPMTDALCAEALPRVARSLRVAAREGTNAPAREDMSWASLCGGLALANAGLGAVHGLAGPIGGMFPAPHGAVCAALLPQVMNANLSALEQRQPRSPSLGRYVQVARLLTGEAAATAETGVKWVRQLVADLRIPGLATYGIHSGHLDELAAKSTHASSMKANPIELTPTELRQVLVASL